MTNKYVNRAKLDERKFRELTRFFTLDLTAIQIAELTNLNRNTVNRYLTEMRKKILIHCISTSPFQQVPKFHDTKSFPYQLLLLTEQNERIYTDLLQASDTFTNIETCLKNCSVPSHVDAVVLLKNHDFATLHPPLHRSKVENGKINRIKSFWGRSKSRLSKFKGMHSSTLILHIKECEFRYNNREKELYEVLLKIFRNDPLF